MVSSKSGNTIKIHQIAQCVGEAYDKAFTPANITVGFTKAGIYPFDENIFTESDILMSAVTDRNQEGDTEISTGEKETSTSQLPETLTPIDTNLSIRLFSSATVYKYK